MARDHPLLGSSKAQDVLRRKMYRKLPFMYNIYLCVECGSSQALVASVLSSPVYTQPLNNSFDQSIERFVAHSL